jgi:23S rRNA (cytidine2498-2'-O)-methyltransferase
METTPWLIRIADVFEPLSEQILQELESDSTTRLGQDYYLIKTPRPESIHQSNAAKFLRWNLPMEHTWPCNARKMDGFIEKAAQTLLEKFGKRKPQGIFIGTLNPGSPDKYYKGLASNLRGRTLQLFLGLTAATVEDQDPTAETLYCLVGKEGLFCGMQSPRTSNGLYPGGSKFIDQDAPDTISRAGAKIAEALHYLLMHRAPMPAGSHWIELGACPGGMTSELLKRDQKVTAIDRASLDKRLDNRPGLTFILDDVGSYIPKDGILFDAILSDLNGPAEDSIQHVIRMSEYLREHGLVVFTLKLPHTENIAAPTDLYRSIIRTTAEAGLRLIAKTHLTYNRNELTLFFDYSPF